jgi:autotransporter-associated beta strand protein
MTSLHSAPRSFSAKKKALVTALLASASFIATTGTASAANCNATSQATYDACVTTAATGDVIVVTAAVNHDFNMQNPGVTISVSSGGSVTEGPGSFSPVVPGAATRLVINSGGTVSLTNNHTFASLAGAGTLNLGNDTTFGSAANTAFSGTVNGGRLLKAGTGALTINGATFTGSGVLQAINGTVIQSGGTTTLHTYAAGGFDDSTTTTVSGGAMTVGGAGGFLSIGASGAGTHTLNQSGGSVQVGAAGASTQFIIGTDAGNNNATVTGIYNMSGGTLDLGIFGDAATAAQHGIGFSSGDDSVVSGALNLSGGTLNLNTGDFINGDNSAAGTNSSTSSTITMTGGILSVKAGATLWLSGHDNGQATDSTFNLNGGFLQVGGTGLQAGFGGGTGTYAFNMGTATIQVTGSDLNTSVNGTLTGATAATGTVIDTNGLNADWNGILSGTGWLVKTGAGTLTLDGVNTYTGGTAFNGGTVLVDAASDLGALSAAMSFNGGTLQLGASNVLQSRTGGTTMVGAGTIDTNGFSTTYDGSITGAGALTKSGLGLLDLGGNNNAHTGDVNITGGTLNAFLGSAIGDTSAVSVSSGATFRLGTSETIGSLTGAGAVNLTDQTLTTGGNNTSTTYSGAMSGTGNLTKTGTGTMTLSGTNTHTGTTTVSNGVLALSGGAAIANTGAVVVTSPGELQLLDTAEEIGSLAGTGLVKLNAFLLTTGGDNTSTTYSGIMSGTGGLTKTGTGVFTLSGVNTYTGVTTVSGGTLALSGGSAIVDTNAVDITAGTLLLNASETIGSLAGTGGAVDLASFTLTTGGNNATTTFAGNISGTGNLTKTGTGVFTLSGTNTHTGTTTVSNGTLALSGGAAIADTGAVVVTSPGGLVLNASETIGSLSGAGAVNLNTFTLTTGGDNTSTTYSGIMSGTGGLTKTGTGVFTLSGVNTYTGTTSLLGGTLALSGGSAIVDSGAVDITAGTLLLNASETIGSLGGTGGTVNLGANALTTGGNNASTTYAGSIIGTGTLTKTGTGVFTLSGTNTYTGTTTVLGGTLALTNGAAIADTGAVVLTAPGSLALNSSETIGSLAGSGAVNLNANTLTTGGNNTSTTYTGIMSGTGGLTKAGTGTMTLSGANTYSGVTTISGGTLTATGGSAIADVSRVDISAGATLALVNSETIGSLSGSGFVTLGANTLTTGGDNLSFVYTGVISGTGSFTKIGTGNQTLSGVNTFTGPTTISAGTLTLGGGSAIADSVAVTVNAPGQLTLSASETIGSLAGSGAVNLGANTLTAGGNNSSTSFTGTTGGTGGLTKTGTGTFDVATNLNHTGLTSVNAGTMILNGTMDGSLLVASGANFRGNATISGNVTNNGTMGPGNSPGIQTIAGNYVAGSGAVFDMELQLNNLAAPVNGTTHDFISIGGNASGTTLINLIQFAPSNAPVLTTGNGVELVRVEGTTTAAQFALAAPLYFDAYEYALVYLADYSGTTDGYFLQTILNPMFIADATVLSASQAMMAACFRGEDSLIGDGNGRKGRAWARITHGKRETGADTGVPADTDYTCGSGGVDLRANDTWRFGISGGLSETIGELELPTGMGDLEGDGGMVQASVGAHRGALFADLSLGYGQTNWTFKGPTGTPLETQLDGMLGSLQVGGRWPMGKDWRFGAIAEVVYDDLSCGVGDCLLAGTIADNNNWFFKGTLRADGSAMNGKLLPFAALSLSHGESNTVTFGTASLEADTNSMLFGAKAGASFMLSDRTALFLNAGVTEGLDSDVTGLDGTAGVKLFW